MSLRLPLSAAACLLAASITSEARITAPHRPFTLAPTAATEWVGLDATATERFAFHLPVQLPVPDGFDADLLPFIRLAPKRQPGQLSLELYQIEVGSVPYDVFTRGNRYN